MFLGTPPPDFLALHLPARYPARTPALTPPPPPDPPPPDRPKIRLFFLLPPLLPSLGCLPVEYWWCVWSCCRVRRGFTQQPKNSKHVASNTTKIPRKVAHHVKPRRGRRGSHDGPENSKRAFWRAPKLQTPPKFHEKMPTESTQSEILGGRTKKKARNFGPQPPFAPLLLLLLLLLLGLAAFDFPKCLSCFSCCLCWFYLFCAAFVDPFGAFFFVVLLLVRLLLFVFLLFLFFFVSAVLLFLFLCVAFSASLCCCFQAAHPCRFRPYKMSRTILQSSKINNQLIFKIYRHLQKSLENTNEIPREDAQREHKE